MRASSRCPLLAYILVVSMTFVKMDSTTTPLASGLNFTKLASLSPTAQALWGRTTEYMIFPGHVFSISRVCWYSRASEVKDRRRGTDIMA